MNIEKQTALITGATRGIGRALTDQLIADGARVLAVGRDRDRLAALTAGHGDRVVPYHADLADPAAVDALLDAVVERHPELTIVINNAATQAHTDFLAGDAYRIRPALRREIAVNLDAVVAISTGLLPLLRQRPAAAIINLTTGLAMAPKRAAPVYCATKAGVRTFTRALRYQCERGAPHVRVSEAMMPLVDTDMTRGRGTGKITASAAARAVLDGLRRDSPEIYVGKARLLPALMRVTPALGYRMLRDG
ncbi:SDR family oxidoreductase [Actinoplanes aureus]|uniref:SDR family NAD(P)-dependent oxidoreductase n=1 Tax=Actinoplanes aureus TaxID=2792083 RepID=A0A931G1W1_9ACTN|nr:SDR family NAD(P)-dependent oxidoreductase [Actinoplanes aureus]MBG0568363.1 SDR family NAD(P)-dependent oxidoreductase [Actinoplanes aureus]